MFELPSGCANNNRTRASLTSSRTKKGRMRPRSAEQVRSDGRRCSPRSLSLPPLAPQAAAAAAEMEGLVGAAAGEAAAGRGENGAEAAPLLPLLAPSAKAAAAAVAGGEAID